MTADGRLREAYERAVAARAMPERGACPTPEALLALVRREGRERERLETLDHAMACAACRDEFELLRSIEAARGAESRTAVERIRWGRYASLAVAASALVAVSVGPGRRLLQHGADVTRSGAEPASEVTLVAPASTETLAAGAPLSFTWRPVPGAGRYTVEVLDADGSVMTGAETSDTTITVTDAARLAAGEYRWTVSAQVADGTALRSPARPLHLRAP